MAQNLSVSITTTDNATTQVTAQVSLEAAIGTITLANVQKLEITAGTFNTTDWQWLKAQKANLKALTHFTISDGVSSVANIPNSSYGYSYFNTTLQEVSVAKVESIGQQAFYGCSSLSSVSFPQATIIEVSAFYGCSSLSSVSFPQATSIGVSAFYRCSSLSSASFPQAVSIKDGAFNGCQSLTTLTLGATPPAVGYEAFNSCPATRYLVLADTEGNRLSGDALTTARSHYKAVDDGNTEDNLWYGWDFAQTLYLVSAADCANGRIVPTFAAAPSGIEVALTVTPNAGYLLIDGTLEAHKTDDATTPVTITDGAFTMPEYDVTVTAQFEALPQTLTVATVENGSITASPSTGIVTDTEITLTVTPSVGYKLKEGSLNAYKTDDQSVTFPIIGDKFFMSAYDVTVTAEFEVIKYNLTYTAGANGSLTGETVQTVNYGTDGTAVTAVANTGYHFVQWSDGETANPRTDANVIADVTVEAEFAINTYTLTYTASANGAITGDATQTVNHGSAGTSVTAVANAGYHFVKWSDDITANPRTDVNVIAEVTVEAEFSINTYSVTYTASANGAITGDATQTVNHGTNGTEVEAVPAAGYLFVKWSDGVTANPRTDVNVIAEVTVEAEFAINTYTLTYTASANGAITGDATQTVNHGSDGTAITAVPNAGYHFTQWSDGETANPRIDANVTADVTVDAEFAEDSVPEYTLTFELVGANQTPVAGATININNVDLTSNSEGKAEIRLTNGDYSYTISLEGYEALSDEVTINGEDKTVPVNMVKLGLEDNMLSDVKVYPNPFTHRLVISGARNVSRIVVTNLIGQPMQVSTQVNANSEWVISTTSLKSGIYLVTLYSTDGKRVVRKVVKE